MSLDEHDSLLKSVSRSFYLSMRFLPHEMREPISLGYLLARFTDTIADTPGLPDEERLVALDSVRQVIHGDKVEDPDVSAFAKKSAHEGEKELLSEAKEIFEWYRSIDDSVRDHLSEVILTIIHGQTWDIKSFQDAGEAPCENGEDLLRYTYWVAGCVGEFWTKVGFTTMGERFSDPDNASQMLIQGRKLGQGLQLINILRDLHEDLPNGRIYLPGEELSQHGWDGTGRPEPSSLEPVYDSWLETCLSFLDETDLYVRNINNARVRICTRLPFLLARETALKMKAGGFDEVLSRKVKIPRSSVWKSLGRAVFF